VNGRLYEALWLTQEPPDILNLNYYVSGSGYLVATIATAATIPHHPADVANLLGFDLEAIVWLGNCNRLGERGLPQPYQKQGQRSQWETLAKHLFE